MASMMQTPLGRDLLGNARQLEGNTLEERFLLPPFSYLDSTSEAWQTRRAAWARKVPFGFPVDPVLVELLYFWFCPTGGAACSNFTPAQEILDGLAPDNSGGLGLDFSLNFHSVKRPWLLEEYDEMQYLKPDRFAAVVMPAEWQGGKLVYGNEADLQSTAQRFGLGYLNEIILGHEAEGAPMPWMPAQTQTKIFIFCKGNPRAAAMECNRGRNV